MQLFPLRSWDPRPKYEFGGHFSWRVWPPVVDLTSLCLNLSFRHKSCIDTHLIASQTERPARRSPAHAPSLPKPFWTF